MPTKNSSNDKQILKLKEVVSQKKEELAKLKNERKGYKTNLVFNFYNEKYNFHVLTTEAAKLLLVRLGMYKREAEHQEVELIVDGHSLDSWMDDIRVKLRESEIREKEIKLKAFEKTLDEKLSEDTKTKMEIDEISDMLNDINI